jgi:hypothetical protein
MAIDKLSFLAEAIEDDMIKRDTPISNKLHHLQDFMNRLSLVFHGINEKVCLTCSFKLTKVRS